MATVNTDVLRSGLARGLRISTAASPARELESRSDSELIVAIAGGEADPLGELYDRYSRVVYGLALRIIRDRALAEDAVQEAFLSVWRAAGSFNDRRGSARSWLLLLAHRRAVDVVRRNQRSRVRDDSDGAHDFSLSSLPASDAAELDAERRTVQTALASLSTKQRTVLELAYYGGYTQQEIAARLGLPIATVKSQTSEALRRLRDLLESHSDPVVGPLPNLRAWPEANESGAKR